MEVEKEKLVNNFCISNILDLFMFENMDLGDAEVEQFSAK